MWSRHVNSVGTITGHRCRRRARRWLGSSGGRCTIKNFLGGQTVPASHILPGYEGSRAKSVAEVVHRAQIAETVCCWAAVTFVFRHLRLPFVIGLLIHGGPERGNSNIGVIHEDCRIGVGVGRCYGGQWRKGVGARKGKGCISSCRSRSCNTCGMDWWRGRSRFSLASWADCSAGCACLG